MLTHAGPLCHPPATTSHLSFLSPPWPAPCFTPAPVFPCCPGEKVAIFAHHQAVLDGLQEQALRAGRHEFVRIDGGVSRGFTVTEGARMAGVRLPVQRALPPS